MMHTNYTIYKLTSNTDFGKELKDPRSRVAAPGMECGVELTQFTRSPPHHLTLRGRQTHVFACLLCVCLCDRDMIINAFCNFCRFKHGFFNIDLYRG